MANITRRGEGTPVRRVGDWDPFQMIRELAQWNPFQDPFPTLARSIDERLALAPAFDVRETKDAYVFQADLPGYRDQDIEIDVTGNRLTVSGRREEEKVEDSDRYYTRERSYGSFARSFTLPSGIDADKIEAEMKDGILSVCVPKTAEAQPKRITVRGAQAEATAQAGPGKQSPNQVNSPNTSSQAAQPART